MRTVFSTPLPQRVTGSAEVTCLRQELHLPHLGFRSARFWMLILVAGMSVLSNTRVQSQVSVLTSRNNNSRTALNNSESLLNSVNVNSGTFAKLGSYTVDGYVVGQPLYMANVSIPGVGVRNVVFVVDQHDSAYAFDADHLSSGTPLWQRSFINPSAGVTSVPILEQGCAKVNGYTEMGIQSTPVIDPATGTLYLDAKTKEVSGSVTSYVHKLHALDVATGQDKFGGSVQITGSVQGNNGTVTFDSSKSCQRPGLLLSNGIIYLGFGTNGCDTTRGWVFAYNATTLVQVGIFSTSPNQPKGAIWQGGAGLAADDENGGGVFFLTANGMFDANTGGSDYGDSFLKLNPVVLSVDDYFTPYDQAIMESNDLDLGSGGIVLLPDQGTLPPHLALGAGKTGTIYLVDRDNLGQFQAGSNSQIVQSLQSIVSEIEGTPAYWNSAVYFAPVHSPIKAFALNDGRLSTMPIAQSLPVMPIGEAVISSSGPSNGILWLIRQFGPSSAMLSAFDGVKLTELYNSTQVGSRDSLGAVAHFVIPTVANGKVFVGTQTQLAVYGLLPALSPLSGGNQTGAAGSTLPGVAVTFSDGGKGGFFNNPNATTDSAGKASTSYTMPKTFQSTTIKITATSPGHASATFTETITAGPPAAITLVSGGSQTGTVGTTLPAQINVKVADQYGNAVAGASVNFVDGGIQGVFGSFFPTPPITTGRNGTAAVSYTLPTKAGFVTITASVAGVSKDIREHALAGNAFSMSIVSGNNQTANRNTTLPKLLVVKVVDQYGNPVANITVSFSDNGAQGTFSSPTAITNASGQASVSYTTPGQSGMVSISASATGLTTQTFTENVL